jgi:hypothetical protein
MVRFQNYEFEPRDLDFLRKPEQFSGKGVLE